LTYETKEVMRKEISATSASKKKFWGKEKKGLQWETMHQ